MLVQKYFKVQIEIDGILKQEKNYKADNIFFMTDTSFVHIGLVLITVWLWRDTCFNSTLLFHFLMIG